jgi:hypothetical protein
MIKEFPTRGALFGKTHKAARDPYKGLRLIGVTAKKGAKIKVLNFSTTSPERKASPVRTFEKKLAHIAKLRAIIRAQPVRAPPPTKTPVPRLAVAPANIFSLIFPSSGKPSTVKTPSVKLSSRKPTARQTSVKRVILIERPTLTLPRETIHVPNTLRQAGATEWDLRVLGNPFTKSQCEFLNGLSINCWGSNV